ncbi:MAG: hypothetical protein ACFFD4_17865 [Candidatus Odinarchaeota archaeon]
MMKMMKKTDPGFDLKVSQKITYYALQNCISCVYLFPVISYAKSIQLIDSIEIIMATNKEEYRNITRPVLESYFPIQEISSPIIIMNDPESGISGMVKPEIVQECAENLIQQLTQLGNDTMIDFLDGEFELELYFHELLFKMASNLIEGGYKTKDQ